MTRLKPTIGTTINSLATANSSLAKEWHPTKNSNLTPRDITAGSHKKVWWQCRRGHEWQAVVYNRSSGKGCPYCSGKAVCKDNCLQTVNPVLAKEWHPTKNKDVTAQDVTANSHKKVWWQCTIGHEWQTVVKNRNRGKRCPYCSGRFAWEENCLQTVNPVLAKEWHPTKNKDVTAQDVTANSHKKVWWQCTIGHEWQTAVYNRSKGTGCPYCTGQAVSDDNCLQVVNPALVKEWHPTKNKGLTAQDVTAQSNKKVWWRCVKDHEWQAAVYDRNRGKRCPYCSGRFAWEENCLQTVNPALAKEWHPTKNKDVTAQDVTANSSKKVWWQCRRGHEWQAVLYSRSNGRGCPFCYSQTSQLELRVFCEMKHIFGKAAHRKKFFGKECDVYLPELNLAIEVDGVFWHDKKVEKDKYKNNFFKKKGFHLLRLREGNLERISDTDIFFSTKEKHLSVVLKLVTAIAKHYTLSQISRNSIKRYLNRRKFGNDKEYKKLWQMLPSPSPGNSLFDINPVLAKEWHLSMNGDLTAKDVGPYSNKKVWWQCRRDHEWQAAVYNRSKGTGCPYCTGQAVCKDNCLQTVNPVLAKEWHPTENGDLTPRDTTAFSNKKVWWQCSKGHEWQAVINSRSQGRGCPYCRGRRKKRKSKAEQQR